MIVCHRYRFIFLKTNKTAGTSIEIALSKYCGPGDIITPVSPGDEEIRKSLGYPGPQNYYAPLKDHTPRLLLRALLLRKPKIRFYNHMPAAEVMQYLPKEIWESYFKFCFERNPWDRVVSQYYFRFKEEPRPSMDEFLRSSIPQNLKRRGWYLYTVDGKVVVDKIYKYEELDEAMADLQQRLGLPEKPMLPRAKGNFRKDKKHYREILDENHRQIIARMFKEEIDMLGYTF